MQKIARILIDQAHNQAWAVDPAVAARMNPANPADASYEQLALSAEASGFEISTHDAGLIDANALSGVDILVIPHVSTDEWEKTVGVGSPMLEASELDAIEAFVNKGGSLLILGETEQPKYGNNLNELAAKFGVKIANATVQDPTRNFKQVPTWILADFDRLTDSDFAYRVSSTSLYRAGVLEVSAEAKHEIFMRSSEHAMPASAPLGVAVKHGDGRVVVLADSDIFGDDSINDCDNKQLWLNIAGWLANARSAALSMTKRPATWAASNANWIALSEAIEALRPMQAKDGSIDAAEHSHDETSKLLDVVLAQIDALAPRFAHQSAYFAAVKVDLENWRRGGFGVPDFYDSLELFRPDLTRRNNVENFAVFSMYTQNGNPNRNLEAVITNTFWPDWLAAKEQKYNNPAFVPIEFIAFTSGYDTNSAVFFPETVATRSVATYYWGGIFCDREAARFRRTAKAAQELLYLPLPADAERLILDQKLA